MAELNLIFRKITFEIGLVVFQKCLDTLVRRMYLCVPDIPVLAYLSRSR